MILPGTFAFLLAVRAPLIFLTLLLHIFCRSLSSEAFTRLIISESGSLSSIWTIITRAAVKVTVSARTSPRTAPISLAAAKARPARSLKSTLSVSLRSGILPIASSWLELSALRSVALTALAAAIAAPIITTAVILEAPFLPAIPLGISVPCRSVLPAACILGPVALIALALRPVALKSVCAGSVSSASVCLTPVSLVSVCLTSLCLRSFVLYFPGLGSVVLTSLSLRSVALYSIGLRSVALHTLSLRPVILKLLRLFHRVLGSLDLCLLDLKLLLLPLSEYGLLFFRLDCCRRPALGLLCSGLRLLRLRRHHLYRRCGRRRCQGLNGTHGRLCLGLAVSAVIAVILRSALSAALLGSPSALS